MTLKELLTEESRLAGVDEKLIFDAHLKASIEVSPVKPDDMTIDPFDMELKEHEVEQYRTFIRLVLQNRDNPFIQRMVRDAAETLARDIRI